MFVVGNALSAFATVILDMFYGSILCYRRSRTDLMGQS